MKILSKITNGLILILIGIIHTRLVISNDGFGFKFREFAHSGFFRISNGLGELPYVPGTSKTDTFAAFWFFYFGILIIPLGLLVHAVERKYRVLPHSFTISYLIVVATGTYMIPASGMTYIMLPHAVYMLLVNFYKSEKTIERTTKNTSP